MVRFNDVELHGLDRLLELNEGMNGLREVVEEMTDEVAEIVYAGRQPKPPIPVIYSPHIWLDIIEEAGEFALLGPKR